MKKNKASIFIILLVFAFFTLGSKGISDYTEPPSFEFHLSGIVQTISGFPQSGVGVSFDLAFEDTSFSLPSEATTTTSDSGTFDVDFHLFSGFSKAVRIIIAKGNDTVRRPWIFTDSASRKEETQTITTNDCNAHKKIIPVAEIYTFKPQTIFFP